MLLEPTLVVKRLVINRSNHVVYDELFHAGINVIRGENSSGKSTILNAIFYGLGGDLSDWSQAALLCTHVNLEVEVNGKKATLRREIAEQAGQPMRIFGAEYDIAVRAPIDEWRQYPYRRSSTMESFSQALFRLLSIPEVANDETSNLTIHQILRLLYADQLSPVESLFRFERFDPPALRDAVGRLLCGSYDAEIYESELEIRALGREFDAVSGELRSLFAVLGKADQAASFEWIRERRASLERERDELVGQIEVQQRHLFELGASDQLTLAAQQDAYARVQSIQQDLAATEQERDALQFDIADSAAYVASLEAKVTALNDASLTAEHIGGVRFGTCPACYAPIEEVDQITRHACHLCKMPFGSEHSRNRIVALINEAGTQLKQSRILQERRHTRLENLHVRVANLRSEWAKAAQILSESQRLPSTDTQEQLRGLNRRAGYLEREIESLTGQERIVNLIRELSDQKEELNGRIAALRTKIENSKLMQARRFNQSYNLISEHIKDLLRNDLRRQDSFENPTSIEFDFAANQISVDGQAYFSASSRVILKSSFFLGFWAAATTDGGFRHPRFTILDTIEDKGMEPERSHNFQNQILRKSRETRAVHQVIYATAMISPDLDDEEFTVGKFSTRDDPTLALQL